MEGVCGEEGETSHGGSWEDAPSSVRKCALLHGFNGRFSDTKSPFRRLGPVTPYIFPDTFPGRSGGGEVERPFPGIVYN